MMLFKTSWCKSLKTDSSRERDMYLCHLTKAFFCQINTLINTLSLENKRLFFNHLFGCPKANFDLECYAKQKNYMLKMILLHPNLAANAKVLFKLCSLLITTLSYHASKT